MIYLIPYLLLQPSVILIFSAVIPAIILLKYIWRQDKLEQESPKLLGSLVLAGIISTLLAMAFEIGGEYILQSSFTEPTIGYYACEMFLIVGPAEEFSKYFMLKRKTWLNPEFNCMFDGVLYAVFTSLGFALWENIKYVLNYGFSTAIVRAITAVPGHCSFGVFMGIFYSKAREYEYLGMKEKAKRYKVLAVVVPAAIHGMYDFIASIGVSDTIFLAFIVIMFIAAFNIVKTVSKDDKYI